MSVPRSKITYAVQEHFVGSWSDDLSTEHRDLATREYERRRHETPRRVRLICRIENVIEVDNKMVKDWAIKD